MAKKLEYQITTDSSQGIKGVNQYASAVKKAMKSVDDSTDDASTNAQKLAKVYSNLADNLEVEFKAAAKAADALGKALGPELAQGADIDKIVADLHRAGAEFDDITAHADELAASFKKMDAATQPASRGVDDIGKSANSSKSALANMVGNSAQDLGQLGGLAGSSGVLIGQMAEYMADASLEGEKFGSVMKNFAGIAAPVALIASTIAIISGVMQDEAQRAEEAAARTQEFGEALRSGADDATALVDALGSNIDKMTRFNADARTAWGGFVEGAAAAAKHIPLLGGAIGDAGQNISNVVDALEKADIGFRQVNQALALGGDDGRALVEAWVEIATIAGQISTTQGKAITDWYTQQAAAADGARKSQKLWNVTQQTANLLLDDFLKQRDPLNQFTDEWNTLFRDMADGKIDSEATADAINRIATALGLTVDQVIALAQQHLDDQVSAAAKAADDAAKAYEDWTKQMQDLALAAKGVDTKLLDASSSFNDMGRASDAITSAFDLKNAPLKVLDNVTDIHDAMRDLATFISDPKGLKGKIPNIFNPNDVNSGAFLQKIESLRGPIQQQIVDAFSTGGAPAAKATADTYVRELSQVLRGKISKGDIEALLGLDSLDATIKVGVEQKSLSEAQLLLDELAGLPGADPKYVANIQLALTAGDITPDTARVLAARALKDLGVDVPSKLAEPVTTDAKAAADRWAARPENTVSILTKTAPPNPAAMQATKDEIQGWFDAPWNKVTIHTELAPPKGPASGGGIKFFQDAGGTSGPYGGIAGERRPEIIDNRFLVTGPTYVPPGTRVTGGARTARILRTRGTRGLRRYDSGGTVAAGPSTVNVNLNGVGAIGNRFDLMRTMRRAERDLVRLLGHRG